MAPNMTPEEQSLADKLEVKIKPAANGYILKCGAWYVYGTLDEVFDHLRGYFLRLRDEGQLAKLGPAALNGRPGRDMRMAKP